MASSYVVAGGCACTRVFSRNGKLSSRAYCLLLLVVVVLCTQLSAAQSYGKFPFQNRIEIVSQLALRRKEIKMLAAM